MNRFSWRALGKELHVARAAVVADHREARHAPLVPRRVEGVDEAPVHLVRLARLGGEAHAGPPRRRRPPGRRGQVRPGRYVLLHPGGAAGVALGPYPVEARRGVGHPRPDEPVELVLEAGEDGGLRPRPGPAVHAAEALLPQRPGPAARQPGQPLELGQVHRPGVEAPPRRAVVAHVRQGLVYNLLQAAVLVAFHIDLPPYRWRIGNNQSRSGARERRPLCGDRKRLI